MDTTEPRKKLWAMIRKYRFAMMTSQHESESLRSRPMTTIDLDSGAAELDGSLWFYAHADSELVRALSIHEQVCLSYGNSDAQEFVCVAGTACVVSDAAKKREHWNTSVGAWFPEGPNSDGVVLIRVKPDHAEYWDSSSNKLVRLFSMAKAAASGVPPKDEAEHRRVTV